MATLFPHLTSSSVSPNYREVVSFYRKNFAQRVAEGTLRPLVLPYHLYGFLILLVYLCIPHTTRPWLYSARWGVLCAVFWWQWKTMREASSMSMATAFAAGLVAAWGIVWSSTWLVWCRPQFDAKRVQRRRQVAGEVVERREYEEGNGKAFHGAKQHNEAHTNSAAENVNVRKRTRANGNSKLEETNIQSVSNGSANGNSKLEETKNQSVSNRSANGVLTKVALGSKDDSGVEYYWQPYPNTPLERVTWVLDLLANFRGPGWNWAIPPLPSLPPYILAQLNESISPASKSGISSVGFRRFDSRRELINYRILQFIVGYFLLDIVKTVMMKDPYFIFGPNTYALPFHLSSFSPSALQFYREALSSASIIISLEMVFILAPLIFSIILGPQVLGLRAEAWYYPTTWGFFSRILDKGLNGLWGSWWHQTFRFSFSAPTNYSIARGYLNPKSIGAKILGLGFAFGISGFLHTGGSISQLPSTHPSHAPIFFMLQAVGIALQMTTCLALNPLIKKFPKTIRRTGNFLFTWVWLYYTGWWLTDDFARGGIWLYEPIPISPLRALGFGVKGDSWWCWEHIGVGWYKGKHWWESGLAI